MLAEENVLKDASVAARLVFKQSWRRLVASWVYVPAGIIVILLACFGIHSLISLSTVSFPASVACMIMLFFFLIGCELLLGDRKTKAVLKVVEVPTGFTLRYINIFFCPSFVLLPLSPAISGVDVAKIIAVFIIGFAVMFPFTAYLVRGMQLVFGSSKRAITERAEEMGSEDDDIPLTLSRPEVQHSRGTSVSDSSITIPDFASVRGDLDAIPTMPLRAQDPAKVIGTGGPPVELNTSEVIGFVPQRILQHPLPLTRAQRWAAFATAKLDTFIYTFVFVCVGLPVYYATSYAMPLQLCLNILAYFTAISLPARWRQFLHPVLVSSAITIIGIWILALVRRDSLDDGLDAYSTKTRYTQLWDGDKGLQRPGAGDIFGSVLDASIVALALPMFQYRNELKRHFLAIILPNISLALASLFLYPVICTAISLPPTLSLSFASRSLTLALATPATANLGGDLNLVAVLCIMSGILGVLIGPAFLKWLRIPDDDYITRGVTLGSNSSAIATALLLVSDPRAAALSSLSMSIFGTVLVAMTSVPPVVGIVRGLVGF